MTSKGRIAQRAQAAVTAGYQLRFLFHEAARRINSPVSGMLTHHRVPRNEATRRIKGGMLIYHRLPRNEATRSIN